MDKKSHELLTNSLFEEFSFKKRELPENFTREMKLKLNFISGHNSKSFFYRATFGFTALIIIFTAGFFTGTFFSERRETNDHFEHSVIGSAEVITGEAVTIKLVYESENNVEDVKFSISLSEGLAFNSENPELLNTKEINWSGTLKKGRNEIPFVIKALSSGLWRIEATAEYEGASLNHEIIVKARGEKNV
ncbi:MAG: hypothetical protein ACOX2F_11635 [bacterium]